MHDIGFTVRKLKKISKVRCSNCNGEYLLKYHLEKKYISLSEYLNDDFKCKVCNKTYKGYNFKSFIDEAFVIILCA